MIKKQWAIYNTSNAQNHSWMQILLFLCQSKIFLKTLHIEDYLVLLFQLSVVFMEAHFRKYSRYS